jgi:2-polyprenyl-3-methyl-5-hydroxy-6-metoxy-1,4-benzoquinol methylase
MAADLEFEYVGNELALFAEASRWKMYLSAQLRPFLGVEVLEVGAGIGATTGLLCSPAQQRWVALEPDSRLATLAVQRFSTDPAWRACQVRIGTLDVVPASEQFDSILYVDVLEHIEDDAGEVSRAAGHLKPGGHLVVLAPAHQSLFSPFDAAIGHFRRYSASSLKAVGPPGLTLTRLRYLDSVGLIASAANRLLLRQWMPSAAQIQTWDRLMVPISRAIDPLIGFTAGKSVLAVWRR